MARLFRLLAVAWLAGSAYPLNIPRYYIPTTTSCVETVPTPSAIPTNYLPDTPPNFTSPPDNPTTTNPAVLANPVPPTASHLPDRSQVDCRADAAYLEGIGGVKTGNCICNEYYETYGSGRYAVCIWRDPQKAEGYHAKFRACLQKIHDTAGQENLTDTAAYESFIQECVKNFKTFS